MDWDVWSDLIEFKYIIFYPIWKLNLNFSKRNWTPTANNVNGMQNQ